MQEVSFQGESQVDHLIENDNKKSVYDQYNANSQLLFHTRPRSDPEAKLDGNSILVRKEFLNNKIKILDEQRLHLSGFRVVQALKFSLINDNSKNFWVVNTHLHHEVPEYLIRLHEIQQLHLWLENITNLQKDNIFICGDFNLTPKESTYKHIEELMNFKSVYKYIHKKEPKKTFPTGLYAPMMDTDPPGCFDYIWFKGRQIQPQNIHLFGNKPLETDSTIYPSDHMGLAGEFIIDF